MKIREIDGKLYAVEETAYRVKGIRGARARRFGLPEYGGSERLREITRAEADEIRAREAAEEAAAAERRAVAEQEAAEKAAQRAALSGTQLIPPCGGDAWVVNDRLELVDSYGNYMCPIPQNCTTPDQVRSWFSAWWKAMMESEEGIGD